MRIEVKRLYFALAVGVVMQLAGGCASSSNRIPASSGSVEPIRFLYAGNRHLEMEVCGCSISQLGGIDREANLKAGMSESLAGLFHLSAGRTFYPRAGTKLRPRHLQTKREMLLDALNELGLFSLGVSAADTEMGLLEMRKLVARAQFPFLSTNLTHGEVKSLFRKSQMVSIHGKKILFLSVTTLAKGEKLGAGFKLDSPSNAIQKELKAQTESPDWVILLSDLKIQSARELAAQFSSIRIVFGSDNRDPDQEDRGLLLTARAVFSDSLGFGRGVSWVDLEGARGDLFNSEAAAAHISYRKLLQSRLNEWKAQKTKLSALQRSLRKDTEVTLAQLPTIASTDAENLVRYKPGAMRLDASFAKPTNLLTKRQELLRAALRELALNTD